MSPGPNYILFFEETRCPRVYGNVQKIEVYIIVYSLLVLGIKPERQWNVLLFSVILFGFCLAAECSCKSVRLGRRRCL